MQQGQVARAAAKKRRRPTDVDAMTKMELVALYCERFPETGRNLALRFSVEDMKAALRRNRRVAPKGTCPCCGGTGKLREA